MSKHLASLHLTPNPVQISERQRWRSLISFVLSILRSQTKNIQCPNCHSARITTRNRAKKAGGVIGTVGGAASGAVGALSGSEVGMTIGIVAGPPGMIVGSFLGAVIGAMLGGTTGALAGAKLGEVIDERILDNYFCLACSYTFSSLPANT